jgi:hypothetical protein
MSVSLNGTNGLTFNDASTQNTSAFYGGLAFRNRIINGAMVIDQRNAGASVTNTAGYTYCLDRWITVGSQASKFTAQQNAGSVTPPAGFANYLGATSSSAYTVGASEQFWLTQRIEGFNTSDLAWGTASAATVTLSFWVRSSLTGTFGGSVYNSAANYSYPFSYTISSANTWEQKTITIVGPTAGTWIGATNGIGIQINFCLGAGATSSGTAGSWSSNFYASATGAVSVVGTSGATFYITGVQLEKGSTATSFDYRPYGTELQLAQRYCRTLDAAGGADRAQFSGVAFASNTIIASYTFPTMRTSPIATITNPTFLDVVAGGLVQSTNNTLAFSELTSNSAQVAVTNSGTPFTLGHGAVIRNDGFIVVFSAEL